MHAPTSRRWSLWLLLKLVPDDSQACCSWIGFWDHRLQLQTGLPIGKDSCPQSLERRNWPWYRMVPVPLLSFSPALQHRPWTCSIQEDQGPAAMPCLSWHEQCSRLSRAKIQWRTTWAQTASSDLCPSSSRILVVKSIRCLPPISYLVTHNYNEKFRAQNKRHLPAQLIRISSLPNFSARATFKSKSAWSSVKSHWTANDWAGNCLATLSIASKSRPVMQTFAPLFKYQNARLRPMPLEAPVTSTTLWMKYPWTLSRTGAY